MKKLLLGLCSFFMVSFASFAEDILRVGILNGPSCIPVAYMMENNSKANNQKVTYSKYADPQALLPKLLKGEEDIGFMPVNVAAKAFNSSNKAIICAAVCGNGNLALITKDASVKKVTDLSAETVFVAGQGATPEYIFRYILSQNNMEDKVNLEYSIPTANLAASLISDKIQFAVVPEPFATIATSKDNKIVYALDLQKEYRNITDKNTYPLTCIVVRVKYARENPEVVKDFLAKFSESVNWTNENAALAGAYCEKNELGLAAGIVKKAIPKSNYVYIPAKDAKNDIKDMLNIFMSFDSKSIGGKLPDDEFYFE